MKKIIASVFLLIFAAAHAVAQTVVETPDFMRSTGKIYVVYGVLLLIFVGIILFLVRLERSIKRLEQL